MTLSTPKKQWCGSQSFKWKCLKLGVELFQHLGQPHKSLLLEHRTLSPGQNTRVNKADKGRVRIILQRAQASRVLGVFM